MIIVKTKDTDVYINEQQTQVVQHLKEKRQVIVRSEPNGLNCNINDVESVEYIRETTPRDEVAIVPHNIGMPPLDDICDEYIEPDLGVGNFNLNDLSKAILEKALQRNGGDRKRAAQELGISDRTLYRRLKQYGLDK